MVEFVIVVYLIAIGAILYRGAIFPVIIYGNLKIFIMIKADWPR